jgi:hypothetical protein
MSQNLIIAAVAAAAILFIIYANIEFYWKMTPEERAESDEEMRKW